jgi:hypothetical protein
MPRGSEKEKKYKSELMVVVVAQNLYDETLRLLCKEELFPKKSRWLMAQEIAKTANRFLDLVVYANGIIVDTPELAKERHNAQRRAVALCKTLNSGMERARRHYKFSADYLKNWAHIYNHEKKLLTGWISSDKKRYGNLLPGLGERL